MTESESLLIKQILKIVGIGSLGLGISCGSGTVSSQYCETVPEQDSCSPAETLTQMLENQNNCGANVTAIVLTADTVSNNERECCYEVTRTRCPEPNEPDLPVDGRPLKVGASVLQATMQATHGSSPWHLDLIQPSVDGLSRDARQALTKLWEQAALSEHASILSFSKFSLDLASLGAPPALLEKSYAAAQDEIRHAQMCTTLANVYRGQAMAPGPLPICFEPAASLAEFTKETIDAGCIGETLATIRATARLKYATDPSVRQVLTTIVADESKHAELAWETVRWALEIGGSDLRQEVMAWLDRPERFIPQPKSFANPIEGVAAHGLIPGSIVRQYLLQGVNEVIVPSTRLL